jgi:hypothetical protein
MHGGAVARPLAPQIMLRGVGGQPVRDFRRMQETGTLVGPSQHVDIPAGTPTPQPPSRHILRHCAASDPWSALS